MLYFDLLTDDIIIKILEINTYYIEKELWSTYLTLCDVQTILFYNENPNYYGNSSSDENYGYGYDYDYDSDLDNIYGM
tara:strand:+ start:799 stop:1032 length:234 start_codon:yes stop_codon:yes gene_type:complete